MDQSRFPSVPPSDPQAEMQFAPPPPNAGAGQSQPLPRAEAPTEPLPQGQSYPPQQSLPPPPPGPPPQTSASIPVGNRSSNYPQSFEPGLQPPQVSSQPDTTSSTASTKYPPKHGYEYEQAAAANASTTAPPTQPYGYGGDSQQGLAAPPLPPRRYSQELRDDDPSNPIHYTRDPHKLVAYLVPFPKPQLKEVDPSQIPDRFLIYTPPPPPLSAPQEGEKEAKLHKVQRKWQEEVRSAKSSTAKTASWQGVKSKATKGIDWAMGKTTSSNLDFLGRVSDGQKDKHADDGVHEGDETHKTVGVEEMVLIYPATLSLSQERLREEFVNTMLRTKSKAQRDAIISTGLMPVAYGVDILATLVWPFGGLGEIDTVWAYANIRGAKTARSVTKRLSSSTTAAGEEKDKLRLTFTPSQRLEVLRRYLDADCHKTDSKLFPLYTSSPTETDVLTAIGWSPSQSGGEHKNWEDEQWEMTEVKEDLRSVMHKGAREWDKWCKAFAKDPEKAMKK